MVNPLPFLSCVQICGHLVWSCVVGTPWLAQCAGVDIHKGRLITFCLRHKWKLLTTEENLPSDVPGQSAQFFWQIIGLLVGWFWGMVSHFEERIVRAARFACLSLRAGQSSLCLHRKPALQSPEDMTWKFWISVKKHKFSPKHKINVYLWSPAHLPACAVSDLKISLPSEKVAPHCGPEIPLPFREGIRKISLFLGLFPKQRTPPTHPTST